MIQIVNVEPKYCAALEQLQRDCFPHLGEQELMTAEHFMSHCRIYPEGEFVALDGERVVGLGSGFLVDFDFEHPNHTFLEMIDNGYYTTHNPAGQWYYGADISVHPDYRGQGIGRMLYDVRKDLIKRINRRGFVGGGLLPGFAQHKHAMRVQDYVERVVAGELFDKTLSFQLKNGFTVRGLIPNYIDDEASDNWATLLVWDNPDFTE
ncbi:MAG: GNAT family N-acetyltransferase [Anaerolineales bacterium]|nr:GNAT family N-acetyltransferase [Anaerolineales bacterium]